MHNLSPDFLANKIKLQKRFTEVEFPSVSRLLDYHKVKFTTTPLIENLCALPL